MTSVLRNSIRPSRQRAGSVQQRSSYLPVSARDAQQPPARTTMKR